MERGLIPGLWLALLAVAWLSLGRGPGEVAVIGGLWDWAHGIASRDALVVGEIRLPRTLLALLVGAAFGLGGAALQGLLRNPLADPGLVGASQGAALGAAGVFYFDLFGGTGTLATPLAGLLGAGLTLLPLLLLARSGRPALVILAGLAVSTLAGAALAVVLNFAPNPYAMQELVFWLLGSVADRGLDSLLVLAPALALGGALVWGQRRLLAGLALGERVAESLGLAVARGGRLVVLGTALLVGSAVAVAGNVGFVGLLVPHLVRPLIRHRPERTLVPSALAGALLVCAADLLVRALPPGRELKLGVLTSLVGAPFFLWLVWREQRRWT